MAQIDTGLGWSARDIGLMSAGHALMGTKSVVNGLDVPYGLTRADALAAGAYLGNHDYVGDMYAVCDTTCYVVIVGTNTIFISPVNNAMVTVAGEYQNYSRTLYAASSFPSPLQNYYYGVLAGYLPQTVNPDIPVYASYEDLYAGFIGQGESYYKLDPGYAVTCFATWKNTNNDIVTAPILISSNKDYAVLSTDNTDPADYAQFGFLWFGMRFYCSLLVNSPFTPSPVNVDVVDITQTHPGSMGANELGRWLANYYLIQPYIAPDPYEEETDTSEEEGGDGEELEDDAVEEETLPLPSVAGHGFCTIYVPSSQELNQMASYLWSGSFDISQVIKLFSSPMDSILGLSAVPVSLVGSPEQIYLGGVPLTGITMPKYTGRTSVKVDFGSVFVAERWGSYLDYAPYTDFSIYLPFIGIKSIKADDIMGKSVNLTYAIDILSGGCVAYLRPAGGSVLYEWSGQCALQIPVTGRNYDNVFQSAMSVATAAFAAVTAPASAPVLSGAVASAAVQAAATKPHIERSGTVNGITGFLGQLRPYLIRTIPEAYIPADQNKFIGYPAYINVPLSSALGYNEVDSIHLENVTATGAELEEIESILKGGVIF